MDLIADTSAIIAELLRDRGALLLHHPDIRWLATEEIESEVHHEVARRVAIVATRRAYSPAGTTALISRTLRLFDTSVQIIPARIYSPLRPEAQARLADPDDWSAVALAVASNAGIWTEDRDFFGIGLPVWKTRVLLRFLDLA